MSSRDDILAAIRANRPRLDRSLPDVPLLMTTRRDRFLPRSKTVCIAWAECFSIRPPPAIR
jgi:hypothetical protein